MKFAVYCSEKIDNGYGAVWKDEEYIGNTVSSSAAGAINNVRYRRGEIGRGRREDGGPVVIRNYRAVPIA